MEFTFLSYFPVSDNKKNTVQYIYRCLDCMSDKAEICIIASRKHPHIPPRAIFVFLFSLNVLPYNGGSVDYALKASKSA
jgi:hypothetical protein